MRDALHVTVQLIEKLQVHIETLKFTAKKDLLPSYLQVGEVFLGRYKITAVISFREIASKNLLKR